MDEPYTVDTKISEVIGDPVLGEYGRLIFPVDRGYCSGDTLGVCDWHGIAIQIRRWIM